MRVGIDCDEIESTRAEAIVAYFKRLSHLSRKMMEDLERSQEITGLRQRVRTRCFPNS
jgi:hypothetical protein